MLKLSGLWVAQLNSMNRTKTLRDYSSYELLVHAGYKSYSSQPFGWLTAMPELVDKNGEKLSGTEWEEVQKVYVTEISSGLLVHQGGYWRIIS